MEKEEQPEENDSTEDSKKDIKWTINLADQYWNALQKGDSLFAQPSQTRIWLALLSSKTPPPISQHHKTTTVDQIKLLLGTGTH